MAAVKERPNAETPTSRVHAIDDDEAVRRAIAMLLQSTGIGAETYPSGPAFLDALPSVRKAHAECVLTDVRLPELAGLELLRYLREHDFRRPNVVTTAHGDVSTSVPAMKTELGPTRH